MNAYKTKHDGLMLCCLGEDSRQAGRPYWYIVTDHALPHTAFHTRAALMLWIRQRGLTLAEPLPPERTHGGSRIVGEYTRALVICEPFEWQTMGGEEYPVMDNADYTLGKWEADTKTLYVLNPNCRWRTVLPYRETDQALDAGLVLPRSIDWLKYAYDGKIATL